MRQISGEGNDAAQAECVLRRHGGGKPEGKEGVFSFPRETYSLSIVCLIQNPRLVTGALTKQVAGGLFRSLRAIFGCRTRKRPCREAERTETYVSIHDKGADKVLRQIASSVPLTGTIT